MFISVVYGVSFLHHFSNISFVFAETAHLLNKQTYQYILTFKSSTLFIDTMK